MKTLTYPTKDYDFQTYFRLEGFYDRAFYLLPVEGSVLRADQCDYDHSDREKIKSLEPITDGEWVTIDGKEYVTVIGNEDAPAKFIRADSMPTMVMDGHGRLTIDGETLRFCNETLYAHDERLKPFRLSYALRTAQLQGIIPATCEYVLDASGTLEKIGS